MSFSKQPLRQQQYRRASSSSSGWKMLFLLVLVAIFWFYYFIGATGNMLIASKTYDIQKGASISELNDSLHLGITSWRYRLWVRLFAPEKVNLQAGQYVVGSGTTLSSFFQKSLGHPTYTDVNITIIPGWNMYDIDAYLSKQGLAKVGDFLSTATMNFDTYKQDFPFLKNTKSLEGFLYPDTYRIRPGASVDSIIRILLKEWNAKIGSSYDSLGGDAYNTLILASIVEREEGNITNQPIVAGILKKRFDEGIALGADATVCYGYAKTHKECTPSFIVSVIALKNPYNTRSMRGYPPTPISAITLATWDAAAHPENSPYYYYLHDSDGQIHYAATLAEHADNKRKYLQ